MAFTKAPTTAKAPRTKPPRSAAEFARQAGKPAKPATVRITLDLDEALHQRVRVALAERGHLTLAPVLRELLETWLKKK